MIGGVSASAGIDNSIDLALDGVIVDVSEICRESDVYGISIGQWRVVAKGEGINGVCSAGFFRVRIHCKRCESIGLDRQSVALRLFKYIAGR